MRKLFLLLIAIFPLVSIAQVHTPSIGDIIEFYPVADDIRVSVGGYDCFYYTDLAFKDEKVKLKPTYRFKHGVNGLTPYEEIEGHVFTVKDQKVENPDSKKVEKQAYLAFLEREDGENIFIRIPYVRKDEDNKLTRGMTLYFNAYRKINIPYNLVKEMKYIKDNFINEIIMRYSNESSKEKLAEKELYTIQMNHLGGFVPDKLFEKKGYEFFCTRVEFENVEGYTFKQPVAVCRYGDRIVKIPVFEFRGLGTSTYGIGYRMEDFFEKRSDVFNHLANHKITPRMLSFVGKGFEYGRYKEYKYSGDLEQITKVGTNDWYKLKEKNIYIVDRYDLMPGKDGYPNLCVVMKDSINTEFQMPLSLFRFNESAEHITWDNYFILEDDLIENNNKYEQKRAAIEVEIDKYAKKYGKEIGEKIGRGVCTEERYLDLKKRFGVAGARKILCETFKIGWTLEEVRESIGRFTYFEQISSYETGSAYYQIFQYRNYYPQYLTFRNGKLISIMEHE